MNFTETFLLTGAAVLLYMCGWFLIALWRGRNDIADIAWGPGFILSAAVSLAAGGVWSQRGMLVSAMVLLWGARLAVHIHMRDRGKGEDRRYRKWRKEWGRWFLLRSFLQIFLLQGMLLVLVALPVIFINQGAPTPFSWLDALGVGLWLFGFGFEAIADLQLLRFTRNPANRGHLLTRGLWRYSRHPNYFGEVTLWWGLWLLALPLPGGAWTVLGPVTITLLILQVSGIPMLESHYAGRADFADYKRSTSPFFPLPPRRP